MGKAVVIRQEPEAEVPAEVLASAIVKMGNAMEALNKTRLRRGTIVTLIHAHSKVSKRDIELVLNNLEQLEQLWLKPKNK